MKMLSPPFGLPAVDMNISDVNSLTSHDVKYQEFNTTAYIGRADDGTSSPENCMCTKMTTAKNGTSTKENDVTECFCPTAASKNSRKPGNNRENGSVKPSTTTVLGRKRKTLSPIIPGEGSKRLKASCRERKRRHVLNDALEDLRAKVPCVHQRASKLSKIEVLRLAIDYIAMLSSYVNTSPPSAASRMAGPPAFPLYAAAGPMGSVDFGNNGAASYYGPHVSGGGGGGGGGCGGGSGGGGGGGGCGGSGLCWWGWWLLGV